MSVFRTTLVGDFTRGGQVLLHFIRMVVQVLKNFSGFVIFCFLVLFVVFYFLNTDSYERYIFYKWALTSMTESVVDNGSSFVPFEMPDGRIVNAKVSSVIDDEYVVTVVGENKKAVITSLLFSLMSIVMVFFGLLAFVYRTGNTLREEKFLRGNNVVPTDVLKTLLKKNKIYSAISPNGIPFLDGAETSHILLTGSPGSGKSAVLRDILKKIRQRGDRAIVYSTSGEFIEEFYRESDVILNPMDVRSPAWNIWAECEIPSDFDKIAASLIPQSNSGDPFWTLAARTLFSSVAMKMKMHGDFSTRHLLRDLLSVDLSEVAQIVKGTEAAALVSEGAEKTALSVRATLASYINSLKYLPDDGDKVFSIRDWFREEGGDGSIFIFNKAEHKEALRPLITTWLDIAVSSLLSLPEDRSRRIWLIIDELPSLNKLPSLSPSLAEGRKYGGCCVIAFQSFAQLSTIYTPKGAEAISGLCSTWICYRANEPATAKWASDAFGVGEFIEHNEGVSYGHNEIRDGVNLSSARKIRPLVLSTEFMNLPDLSGYVRLPGDYPVGRFKLEYVAPIKVADALVERDYSAVDWNFTDNNDTRKADVNGGKKHPIADHDDLFRTV